MESEYDAPSGSDSFRLPGDSYYELLQIRDQLLLHARCIAPITYQEDDATLELTRNMLADCFQQLALRLARALEITAMAEPDD
jgi:hypothetical protein